MARTPVVEQRSIDRIPESERHGTARSLFFLWFAANTSITAVVTGALFVLLGNTAMWAIPAAILGNIAGAFVTSLHSVQGPRLGVPQMIQSRAQFGFHGATLPLFLALLIYLGFYATGLVLGGQAMGSLLHVSDGAGAVIFAVFSTVLAVFGYRYIHRFSHLATVLSAVAILGLLLRVLISPVGGPLFSDSSFDLPAFILGISLAASWQLTFGPYIADYSRYLPSTTPQLRTFGWTFLGSVIGGSLAMVLGALVAEMGGTAFSEHQVAYLAGLGGPFATVVLIAVLAGKLTGNTLSSYGGYMSVATILTSFTGRDRVSPRARALLICCISLAALAIALPASADFVANFTNFLPFLLYFMTPWSAINLVDYYLVRRERYDIDSLFTPTGTYGRFSGPAFLAYGLGVLCQIPFISSDLYTGPIAKAMGGAEVAWLLGIIISGGLYFVLTRRIRLTVGEEIRAEARTSAAPTPADA